MKKRAVYLSEKELSYLQHILYHFTDYMSGDDRPDHGFGILKEYRNAAPEVRTMLNVLAGRLRRLDWKRRLSELPMS
jgi:hypothetical protein